MKLSVLIPCVLILSFLTSCGPKQLYLISKESVVIPSENDIMKVCLNRAITEMNSDSPPLTEAEKAPLEGISAEYFLWWGSLYGAMPVINQNKQPSEARSGSPVLDKTKTELSERYVLCLLENGYSWPDEEWVKARFNEAN